MKPRKPLFALNYIDETVECFAQCAHSSSFSADELKWANDVLDAYFRAVPVSDVERAWTLFSSIDISDGDESTLYAPYKRVDSSFSNVEYDQLKLLFKQRRSVRLYQDKAVDGSLVDLAIEAASFAPSACNRQPYQFFLISDKEKIREVAECAMGTQGFVDSMRFLVVVVGDLSFYPEERDRHVIYIDASLAAMQFMLALETLGLSSCPINWPDIEARERKLQGLLSLPTYHRPIMMVSVGYALAEGEIPYSQKKSVDMLSRNI